MSIVLTSAKDSKTSQGYFRIGFLTLSIPPSDITTSHTVNNERIGVLRGANEMFRKTGQSRFDVSVTFPVVLNDLGDSSSKYSQWTDLRTVVAMFKSSPFVEVESPYLRQVLAGTDPSLGDKQTIAMALRQLKVDSHPDIVDGLIVTLTMTYFNYQPFSVNFEYWSGTVDEQGKKLVSTDAAHSEPYKDYINGWIDNNLDHRNPIKGDPVPKKWDIQNPGVLSVSYRTYVSINTGQLPKIVTNSAISTSGPIPQTLSPSKPVEAPKGKLPADISQIVIAAANKYGIDPAIAQALCYKESSGNPAAYNKQFGASGLFQFIGKPLMTKYHVTNPFNAVEAADGGCHYLSDLLKQEHTYELALGAYYVGAGTIKKYAGLPASDTVLFGYKPDAPSYVSSIMTSAVVNYGYTGTTIPVRVTNFLTSISPTASNPSTVSSNNQVTNTDANSEHLLQIMINYMCTILGYEVDHRAEVGGVGTVFLYKTNTLKVGPLDSPENNLQTGLYPTQFSVLFVNNLAQIPLSFYQYPTYQHIGPTSSTVQISFISRGVTTGDEDPQHPALNQLTTIANNLEKQFHELRGQFKSVWSIHRTQAVFIENQILNLLGIYGLMVDQITTQTVSESSDMVSVQLTGSQYENIFEEIDSYKMNGISQQYMTAVKDLVFNSTDLDNKTGDEAKVLGALTDYKKAAQTGDETWLSNHLLDIAKNKSADPSLFADITGEVKIPCTDALSLWKAVPTAGSNLYPIAQNRINSLTSSNTSNWTIVDYLMFKRVAQELSTQSAFIGVVPTDQQSSALSAIPLSQKYISNTENAISSTKTAQIKQAYVDLFPYFSANDLSLRSAVNQVMNSPVYGPKIQSSVPTSNQVQQQHGSYAAMRLPDLKYGQDINPASYFINDQDAYKIYAKQNLQTVMSSITSGSTQANSPSLGGSNSQAAVPMTITSVPGLDNANTIMSLTNIPGYDMSEAFPTFKLMFMEDANEGIYYAFDNFFSYATITDIEMERPYDKPATLRVQMTNLSHLLSNKLYDGTLAGAWDHTLDKYASLQTSTNDGSPVVGPGTSSAVVYKNGPGAAPTQVSGSDNIEGARGGQNYKRVPLQYFPLQTGTKIQLRIGNTNDPDQLFPVFCGQVTEIEGDEIITITAQSYLLELCNQISDQAQTDSWFHLGSILGAITKLTPGGSLGNEQGAGPAYGGITIWGDSADTGTIIANMLKNSSARHFGHWQINQLPNQLLKGFTWKELAIPAIGSVVKGITGSDTVANLTSYDRTDENISIMQSTQFDGSKVDYKSGHKYADQGVWYRPLSYHVDSATSWTTWELIQDVARRYPEYLLLEKWYGFPYSSNSTMVYGHPLDWYWARQTLIGDQELEKVKLSDKDLYSQWWQQGGGYNMVSALFKTENVYDIGTLVITQEDLDKLTGDASIGYSNLVTDLNTFLGYSTGQGSIVATTIDAILRSPWFSAGSLDAGRIRSLQYDQIDQINKSLSVYVSAHKNPNGKVVSSELLKPIRRYHFIDHQSLIHNGISINSKIYNCVKIGDGLGGKNGGKLYPIRANANIPNCHLRAIDVTDKINNPKENVIDQTYTFAGGKSGIIMDYAQSFLREEVGKMYRGEIILRGIPEIEPMDVLMFMDIPGALQGPIEVESVIHTFNQETGFITIIKPRCCISVNEAVSGGLYRVLQQVMGSTIVDVNRLAVGVGSLLGLTAAAGVGSASGTSAFAIMNSPLMLSSAFAKVTSFMTATTTPEAEFAAGISTEGIAAGTAEAGAVAAEAGAVAAEGAATVTGLVFLTPPGMVVLGLCAAAVLATCAIGFINASTGLNPLYISPCVKYGRPWMGGVEGWATNDLIGVVNNNIYQFMDEEIFPLLQLWMAANNYNTPITSQGQLNDWVPQLPTK